MGTTDLLDWMSEGWKDEMGDVNKFNQNKMSLKQNDVHVDNLKDEFEECELDALESYYESNINSNSNNMNPAFESARDSWLSNLTVEEGRAILEAEERLISEIVKNEVELDLETIKEK